jgi:hypothetical protein
MKIIAKLLMLLLITTTLFGCSNDNKSIEPTSSTFLTPSPSPVGTPAENSAKSSETQIVISLNNSKFDLSKPFDDAALNSLSTADLSALRNSIYARYGYIFNTKELSDSFTKFSWYKPTAKNVEDKLNDIDNKNIKAILSIESKKSLQIKSYKDTKDYSDAGKVDITLNGKTETLYITKEKLKDADNTSLPTRFTFKIKDSQVVFESLWNDGLKVSVVDFDKTDNVVDIYVSEIGTDIGSNTYIYKCDGSKIYLYDKIRHFAGVFYYDENGNIYYWFNNGDKKDINKVYNYKTKQSADITDQNLKAMLNKLE